MSVRLGELYQSTNIKISTTNILCMTTFIGFVGDVVKDYLRFFGVFWHCN